MPLEEAQESKGIVKIFWNFLFKNIDMGGLMPRIFLVFLLALAGSAGWFLRGILEPDGSSVSEKDENYQAMYAALINDFTPKTKDIFNQRKNDGQDENLPKKIIANINNNKLKKPEDIIRFCLLEILEFPEDFQFSDIKADDKFSEAVSKYEEKQIQNASNETTKEDRDTYQELSRDIKNECLYPRLSLENKDKYDKSNEAIEAIAMGLTKKIEDLVSSKSLPVKIPKNFYEDFYKNQNPQNINSKAIVLYCVKNELGLPQEFQYSYIGQYNTEWEKFKKAIETYQKERVNIDSDGVINKGNDTQKYLKDNIEKKCLKPN
ncbi:MAG: hypothetical protein F6K54_37915 [Okeania sp. SIO3B5]|nr:hypothetical protein [Okeania sp. SIO3B5]